MIFRSLGHCSTLLIILVLGARPQAAAQPDSLAEQAGDLRNAICSILESAARANALPVDFFARVIWQESRFQPGVIGPVTHGGERALGIAQFMPRTAIERRLLEPFNPVEALPKSGEFLAELRDEFGNLGLAAAAYNAGPQRVRKYLAGSRDLPKETRNYVLAITGRPAEAWAMPSKEELNHGNIAEPHMDRAPAQCRDIMALLERAPKPFIAEFQQRNVPSWCRFLRHPNISVCGSIHQEGAAIKPSSLVKLRGHVPIQGHYRAARLGS
jgi:hypothetical protein